MSNISFDNQGKNIDGVRRSPQTKTPVVAISSTPPKLEQISLLGKNRGNKTRHSWPKRIAGAMLLIILLLAGVVAYRFANLSDKIFVGTKTSFFQKLRDAIRGGGDNVRLVGEDVGQINILLLGIGGEGHDGPYLSDTMILAQIRPDIGEIAMVSIPRDYQVQLPNNYGQRKINAAFAEGFNQHKDWNEAGQWARSAAEQLSGLKIPYFAVIDFAGFEKAINQVGGLDIKIDRTFTDYSYPDSNDGYLPPITFTEGSEHMNGTRALQFARSRHAAGLEGSDFARSARQQKIISAFKEKVLNLNLITGAGTINSLLDTFASHFHTNITPGEILRIYNLTRQKDIQNIISLSLDPSTSLVCPKIAEETGAYILVPCEGKTIDDIHNYFKNIFALGRIYAEKSVIWLATSTGNRTAYQTADARLKENNLTVWELGYKGEPLPKTVFYQANLKPATAEFIANTLHATEASLPPPGVKIDKDKVDIIIILGQDE